MEKAKRVTKKDYFTMLREMKEVQANPELVAFIDREVELLNKKRTSNPNSKTAKEQTEFLDLIRKGLGTVGRSVTITELQKEFAPLAEFSNQKISAYLTKMIANNEVVNTKDKKKSYFALVTKE